MRQTESSVKPAVTRGVTVLHIGPDLLTEQAVFFACEFGLMLAPFSGSEEQTSFIKR